MKAMYEFDMIIDGKTQKAASRFDVINPATGYPAGSAPNATVDDLDNAVGAAEAAFTTWSKKTDTELQAACEAIAATIGEHSEELARLVTIEQGKPLGGLGSRWEVEGARLWANHTAGLSLPVKVIQDDDSGRIELHHKPVGVVGSITPWNFPVMIAIWHILPALRAGNTVIIKPSPLTPLATLRLVELINDVLPPGVVNILTSTDDETNIGGAISSHPGIRKIVFTGSCPTGQKVMQSAASTMKRLSLELGGNDAGIVLPDADPKAIVENLFWGIFINNGQTCASLKRLYVHDSIHDEICESLVNFASTIPVGDGLDEVNLLGPIQNKSQFDKVSNLVADAKKRGEVLLGGEPGEGLFFPPTIIAGLKNGDALVDEEQFGPVIPVIRYHDPEEALAEANDSPYGLAGSIWASNKEEGYALAKRMECGSVWLNKHGAIQPNIPFGAMKQSGIGVKFDEEGLEEYTDIQTIFV